jgi:hypothetical protein
MSWSKDYKKSIDCSNPKGFSQKSHCAARKKRQKGEKTKSESSFNEMHEVKSHKTVEQIAKKHRLEVSFIKKQLEMGIPIEHEHTKDKDLATDIALQHLDEIPDYYTRLKKMEADAKKHHKKFKDVKEGNLHRWYQDSKSKEGKPGWVNVVTGGTCASDEPGEGTPKCVSSAKRASMTPAERRSASRRKKAADPEQQSKSGASKPTYVSTDKPEKKMNEEKDIKGKGSGKKDACYSKVKSRYDVWPSAYASGALVKCRKVGAANWGTKSEDCWDGYKQEGMKKKGKKIVPNCVPVKEEQTMMRYCPKCQKDETRSECKYGPKFWDMYSLPVTLGKKYTPNTPHPGNFPESYDHEHSMARSELSTIISAAKRLRNKMKGEGNIEAWVQSKITKAADYLDAAADYVDSGEMKEQVANTGTMSDKKPFDIAVKKIMDRDRKDKMTSTQRISALKQAGKLQGVDEQMLPPIDPEAHKRLQKTQKLYNKGTSTDNPNEKEIFLKRTGPQLPLAKAKSTTQVAHYEPENDLVEYSNWRSDFGLSEDWQKVNRKDKTDGLSQKAVNAYRRENPGSKLQTAVTEKNPTGKRAGRRKNFCSRMSGMKNKLTSAKTARDPDSRINKALRRWNCN